MGAVRKAGVVAVPTGFAPAGTKYAWVAGITGPSRTWHRPARESMSRVLHNVAIAALVAVLILDALPADSAGHKKIKALVDPVLDVTGLWQGSWRLFAPNVDHINTYVTATVHYSDGTTWKWTSTAWSGRSLLQKAQQGRHPKFNDHFRLDKHKRVWPYLSRWVARQAPERGGDVRKLKVELHRHWWEVPPPSKLADERKQFSRIPPPREEFKKSFLYHTETLK